MRCVDVLDIRGVWSGLQTPKTPRASYEPKFAENGAATWGTKQTNTAGVHIFQIQTQYPWIQILKKTPP